MKILGHILPLAGAYLVMVSGIPLWLFFTVLFFGWFVSLCFSIVSHILSPIEEEKQDTTSPEYYSKYMPKS